MGDEGRDERQPTRGDAVEAAGLAWIGATIAYIALKGLFFWHMGAWPT